MKREKKSMREPSTSGEPQVATTDDLAGYGFVEDEPDGEADED